MAEARWLANGDVALRWDDDDPGQFRQATDGVKGLVEKLTLCTVTAASTAAQDEPELSVVCLSDLPAEIDNALDTYVSVDDQGGRSERGRDARLRGAGVGGGAATGGLPCACAMHDERACQARWLRDGVGGSSRQGGRVGSGPRAREAW